jgi:peptidoglycan/LPS O-acetylase OafA/YrhL
MGLPTLNCGRSDGRIPSLQALRAAAALFVLAHHTAPYIFGAATVFNVGYAGVDLFFVLSGFVIYLAHHDDLGRPDRFGRYAKRRVTRIYPTYIVVTLISLPAALYLFPQTRTWPSLVASIFITEWPTHVLDVAWTLVHEVHFYVTFGLCILLPRWGAWIIVAVVVGIATWSPNNPIFSWALPIARLDFEFAMGIIAAILHLRRPWSFATRYISLVAGSLIFVAGASNYLFEWWPAVIPADREDTGFGAMLVVFGAAGLPCPLILLDRHGNASYLIYLIHYQTLAFFLAIAGKLGLGASPLPAVVPALGIVVVSVQLHERVEAPMLEWLRKQQLSAPYRWPAARA